MEISLDIRQQSTEHREREGEKKRSHITSEGGEGGGVGCPVDPLSAVLYRLRSLPNTG